MNYAQKKLIWDAGWQIFNHGKPKQSSNWYIIKFASRAMTGCPPKPEMSGNYSTLYNGDDIESVLIELKEKTAFRHHSALVDISKMFKGFDEAGKEEAA